MKKLNNYTSSEPLNCVHNKNNQRTRGYYSSVLQKAFSLPGRLAFMALDVVEYVPVFGVDDLSLDSLAKNLCCSSGEAYFCLEVMQDIKILPEEFLPLLDYNGCQNMRASI